MAERWIDIVQVKRVSERMMVVRGTVGGCVWNFISIYAPQVGKILEKKMNQFLCSGGQGYDRVKE